MVTWAQQPQPPLTGRGLASLQLVRARGDGDSSLTSMDVARLHRCRVDLQRNSEVRGHDCSVGVDRKRSVDGELKKSSSKQSKFVKERYIVAKKHQHEGGAAIKIKQYKSKPLKEKFIVAEKFRKFENNNKSIAVMTNKSVLKSPEFVRVKDIIENKIYELNLESELSDEVVKETGEIVRVKDFNENKTHEINLNEELLDEICYILERDKL